MISNQEMLAANTWIEENISKAAKARADREYLEAYTKSLKSLLMLKTGPFAKSIAAQEACALAHEEFITHLNGLRAAIERDEWYRYTMQQKRSIIEIWRTAEATARALR